MQPNHNWLWKLRFNLFAKLPSADKLLWKMLDFHEVIYSDLKTDHTPHTLFLLCPSPLLVHLVSYILLLFFVLHSNEFAWKHNLVCISLRFFISNLSHWTMAQFYKCSTCIMWVPTSNKNTFYIILCCNQWNRFLYLLPLILPFALL